MAKLLDLPEEILSQIAHDCEAEAVRDLRKTCSALHRIALRAFAAAYFTERYHVLSSHSLTMLLDITADPFFGPYVKTVIINSVRTATTPKSLFDVPAAVFKANPVATPLGSLPRSEAARRLINDFVASGECRSLLVEIFNNINRHGNNVTVGICDHDGSVPRRSFGWNRLVKQPNIGYLYLPNSTLKLALDAVARSKCTVAGLSLEIHNPLVARRQGHLSALAHTIRAILRYKRGKRFLYRPKTDEAGMSVKLDVLNEANEQERLIYDSRTGKMELFNATLSDEDDPTGPDDSFSAKVIEWWSPKITSLHITNCYFHDSARLLVYLVDENKDHLTSINLDNIILGDDEDWAYMMHVFSSLQSLQRSSFHELYTIDGAYADPKGVPAQFPRDVKRFEAQGEEVKTSLLDIAAVMAWKPRRVRGAKGEPPHKAFDELLEEAKAGGLWGVGVDDDESSSEEDSSEEDYTEQDFDNDYSSDADSED